MQKTATEETFSVLRETAVEHFEQEPEVSVDELTLEDVALYTSAAGETLAVAPDGTGAELSITKNGVAARPVIVDVEDDGVEEIEIVEQRQKPAIDKMDESALRDPAFYD